MKNSFNAVKTVDSETLLNIAAKILARIDKLQSQLDFELDEAENFEHKRLLRHLLFTFFRHKGQIDVAINKKCKVKPKNEVYYLLELALTQLFFQNGISQQKAVFVAVECAKKYHSGGFVNAVLRSILRDGALFPASPEIVLPPALYQVWKKRFTAEQLKQLTDCFLMEPAFSCRLRLSNVSLDFPFEKYTTSDNQNFIFANPENILKSQAFKYGLIYIQDPATFTAISLIKSPENIQKALDLCAAPGGKTIMMHDILPKNVLLTASDISNKRQEITRKNMLFFKTDVKVITAAANEVEGEYDLVLADVPCSNTGVGRHRPDAWWRFSTIAQHKVIDSQRKIFNEAARLTAPGGQLIYSTCSIEPEENDEQVNWFLSEHSDFILEKSKTIYPDATHDGAFAARLRRRTNLDF